MARAARTKLKKASSPAAVHSLLPDVLHQILLHLPQTPRVRASEVCRAWREATLSPALWTTLRFSLPCDDDEGTAESFLAWLAPRARAVERLQIDIQDAAVPPSEFVVGSMANLVAALVTVSATLRHLTIESFGALVVGQWACQLTQLTSACFIGDTLLVKQGLGKLQQLTDLEFGSNSAELSIEGSACLPPSVTHLSLEHCCLNSVPPAITRLTNLRSLDISQNMFGEEEGDECATLADLTGLECLKLANCRMTQVPEELGSLKRLRILHMGGNFEGLANDEIERDRLEAALRPLRGLQVLVISQCNVLLPEAVRRMNRLERLFVTSTPITELPPGPYCKSLCHLCIDWDVAFESLTMLEKCTSLQMLTLARPHGSDLPDRQAEEKVGQLSAVLARHPALKQVNIVAVQGRGLHLSIHTMRFILSLQAASRPLRLELVDSWDSDLVRIPSLVEFDS